MKMEEIIERGFSIDVNGKILDDYGNEYRDENGEVSFIECGDNKKKYKLFVLHIDEWEKNNVAYSLSDMCRLAQKYGINCGYCER